MSLEESWGLIQWILLLVIIMRFPSFSLDFGTQVVAGWIFFVQSLDGENCLVVPPVSLIARAIHYLHVSRTIATIIVPFWPSSFFWPIISGNFSRFVVDCKCFGATALEQGRNTNWFLGSDKFTGFILAVRMKFS